LFFRSSELNLRIRTSLLLASHKEVPNRLSQANRLNLSNLPNHKVEPKVELKQANRLNLSNHKEPKEPKEPKEEPRESKAAKARKARRANKDRTSWIAKCACLRASNSTSRSS
jgi:hypothetical protein